MVKERRKTRHLTQWFKEYNRKELIHNLEKHLIEEKLKVKALSEELENPMN